MSERQAIWPQLRHDLRGWLALHPSLYLPLARRRVSPGVGLLSNDTELVIEGFPRSANSFAVAAFQQAQLRPVEVAHHTHAAAQVIAAAKHGIPVLVLIREPLAAVSSFLVRHPGPGVAAALREFVRFYRQIWPQRNDFVIATFEQVTIDFGAVTARVNKKFGTGFGEFSHTEENVAANFAEREAHGREQTGDEQRAVRRVARPQPDRNPLRETVLKELTDPKYADSLDQARQLWNSYVDVAGRTADVTSSQRMPGNGAKE